MKDIDFLPEWYKNGRRRQIAYRTQYVVLGGMLILMSVWNFVVGHSVSMAEAQVAKMNESQHKVDGASEKFMKLKTEISKLQEKVNTIKQIDSKIDIASVIGELSYLIDQSVTLVRLDMISESFKDSNSQKKQGGNTTVLRAVKSGGNGGGNAPIGSVRFQLIIAGIAENGSDVMTLVSRLEGSQYFSHVVLSYSRDSKIQISGINHNNPGRADAIPTVGFGARNKTMMASEFEIKCYLANYKENK